MNHKKTFLRQIKYQFFQQTSIIGKIVMSFMHFYDDVSMPVAQCCYRNILCFYGNLDRGLEILLDIEVLLIVSHRNATFTLLKMS